MAFENEVYGAVVQTVRMPACQAGGRGSSPFCVAKQLPVSKPVIVLAQIAQSVEQRLKIRVAGSIPALGTNINTAVDAISCTTVCFLLQFTKSHTFDVVGI